VWSNKNGNQNQVDSNNNNNDENNNGEEKTHDVCLPSSVQLVTEPEILTKGGTLYITFSALYIYIGADL
jgi:hypothetical protein